MPGIRAENPSCAWLLASNLIINEGEKISNFKWRNLLGLIVEIENPLQIDEKIHKAFYSIMGKKWGENYKVWHKEYEKRIREFGDDKINQLKYVIQRFKKGKTFDDSVITIHSPVKDSGYLLENSKRPRKPNYPCLIQMDFKLRNSKLNLFATYRSHDFGRKAYGNYRWLGELLKEVCQELNCEIGKLFVVSNSAFIRKDEMEKINRIFDKVEHLMIIKKSERIKYANSPKYIAYQYDFPNF